MCLEVGVLWDHLVSVDIMFCLRNVNYNDGYKCHILVPHVEQLHLAGRM